MYPFEIYPKIEVRLERSRYAPAKIHPLDAANKKRTYSIQARSESKSFPTSHDGPLGKSSQYLAHRISTAT